MEKTGQFGDLDSALLSMDKLIHRKLYHRIFKPKNDDLAKDQVLEQRVRIFSWIELKQLDLDFDLGETFNLATEQLQSINKYHCPQDKTLVILNTSIILTDILNKSPATTSADSLLPLFIYTLLQTNPSHLISNIEYIQRFTNNEQLSGEVGYYFYTLTAAVSFINNLDHKALSNIEKEDFERHVEEAISQLPSTPPASPDKPPTTPQLNIANESKQLFQKTTQGIGKIGKLLGEVVEEGVDKLTSSASANDLHSDAHRGEEGAEEAHFVRSRSEHFEQSRQQFNRSLETLIQVFPHMEPGWIENALAIVNRANDEKATMKLALELTTVIFSSATRLPEFSRNVTQPLAVKYAQKLLDILKHRSDLQIDAINAISDHLTTHSSSFRPQLNALNAQVVALLARSPDNANKKHVDAVARLYSTSARAAGKANVSQTLKKLIETTLKSIEKDVGMVMGDLFGSSIKSDDLKLDQTRAPSGDLLHDAPFLVRRVGVLFYSICKALSGSNDTYIAIPVGSIVALCTRILHLTPATIKENSNKEESVLRVSSSVQLISYASGLLAQLAQLVGTALTPHVNTVLNAVAFHLSSTDLNGNVKHVLLELATNLTQSGAAFNVDNVHMVRIFKATLRTLAMTNPVKQTVTATTAKSAKGKKRSRNQFEADEAFAGSVKLTTLNVKTLTAAFKFIECALHTVPSVETLALKIVVALALDQDWRALMPDDSAADSVWSAIKRIVVSKHALTTPMSSWIVEVTGSNPLLDVLVHPAAPAPIIHADVEDKRYNIKKELHTIKLALGGVGNVTTEEDEEEDEEKEEVEEGESINDKEAGKNKDEDEIMQDEEKVEKEVAKEIQSVNEPQSRASASGDLEFAVPKDEPKPVESITTARPPPVESSKSFTKPLPISKDEDESEDEEMPSIDID
ncbi:hypothetical protein E3Q05_02309 [Wallemia mellicola]|nr:hypothetical protein E3Q05_02309 [Wallemia mellicola]